MSRLGKLAMIAVATLALTGCIVDPGPGFRPHPYYHRY